MKNIVILCLLLLSTCIVAQTNEQLVPPILLENEKRLNGNPLATYCAMVEKEEEYLKSPFADFYEEIKLNLEQFMGIHYSGLNAMGLKKFKREFGNANNIIPDNFKPFSARTIIEEIGKNNQIIIWGEEHHLPQTRVLYQEMIDMLWEQGFRYLAAETFSDEFEKDTSNYITANSGYYLQDPVYATAIRLAKEKGYILVSYDNNEAERDKKQAENINNKIFKRDNKAKVLILAGRGHIAEAKYPNWEPMGYWLKELTGIDPVTIYTPSMSERLIETEEHPLYRFAVENELLQDITIFKDPTTDSYLGQKGEFDIYLFSPPTKLINGRPDWMFTILNRIAFKIPEKFLKTDGKVLIQARESGHPDKSVPVDQLLVLDKSEKAFLALPKGKFTIRSIDAKGNIIAEKSIDIE